MRKALSLAMVLGLFCLASIAQAGDYSLGDLEIGGFVTGNYSHDNTPANDTFSLTQVEVDVEAKTDQAGVRFDLQSAGDNVCNSPCNIAGTNLIEQGYIDLYGVLGKEDLTFRLGKFNAPIGFELLDPVDLDTITHAMVFNNGIPTNLTGALLQKHGENHDLSLYVTNGWDKNFDNNEQKTFGGRLGFNGEKASFGFSGIAGAENENNSEKKTVVLDADLSLQPSENVKIGGEINWGRDEDGAFKGFRNWWGVLALVRYKMSEKTGMTARFDSFNTNDSHSRNFGITLALDKEYSENIIAKLEATYQKTNNTELEIVPKKDYFLFGYELTYKF